METSSFGVYMLEEFCGLSQSWITWEGLGRNGNIKLYDAMHLHS